MGVRYLEDEERVGGELGEAREAVAAGEPAAEDLEVEGGDGGCGGGERELAEEERRQRGGG